MEESSFTIPADDNGDTELDPRIQVELEKLNAATDEINKLELELDESMKTFHLLLNETSRRLQALTRRLGTCVDKSRPYYDALGQAVAARSECQKAAVQFQRASELHAAAKETVTLAEQRFVSKQDEWQFDSNWQEVLNHAIIKVMDAEKRKAESGREHQKKAAAYIAAEKKVTQLEENLKRNIIKSRHYFEEKKLCDEQLQTQNEKIEKLQRLIADAKFRYSKSLKALEEISEEIHRRRGEYPPGKDSIPVGPREPGVGAERDPIHDEIKLEDEDSSLQELRLRVRELALKPIDKAVETDDAWALELNETINKLDQLLMMKENNQQKRSKFTASTPQNLSAPSTSTNVAKNAHPPSDSWKPDTNLDRVKSASREAVYEHTNPPISKTEKSKSMMSLDVLALARDTNILDRESYLKAVIEDKSPTGTYTESNSDRNESPDDILMVECDSNDSAQNPVIRMTSSTVSDSDDS
ncbi:SH3 domain-binding protein 5 homolog isoform X2 [Bombyx mandarina]|uniref:SH3 domain-binding protein 5 homolog n=3 Tax=Bombyx TaxID=7090 RepID=A0A8R1WK41_BOMMO|nr:SH3 domain-binding protein 5 homolog [Bombyx mori]XP_028031901.1 SH3 domain-binding protein 5 homolog isoform X1 [Bombyx mandarina]XP_028031902.1 SH3 domain-binding protein 5 homolog isoform X2 [Bombyx mandarina]